MTGLIQRTSDGLLVFLTDERINLDDLVLVETGLLQANLDPKTIPENGAAMIIAESRGYHYVMLGERVFIDDKRYFCAVNYYKRKPIRNPPTGLARFGG